MSNQLTQATSPYLRQHADNPVFWKQWDKSTLIEAKERDMPILLSIGYSACHWCHVMAHESFEDPNIAQLMNRHFINIKLDREERPDLDRIYQTAHQILSGQPGGWPLTVFIDPVDLVPFFTGTYFPPSARFGMIAFPDLLQHISKTFLEKRRDVKRQNESLIKACNQLDHIPKGDELDGLPISSALNNLLKSFDEEHGGFGTAPKFPHAPTLEWLLVHPGAGREMGYSTLTHMSRGGIQDQLGGGFYRYTIDANWETPHFEKMLYDNAQLLSLYSRAYHTAAADNDLFRQTAYGIIRWANSSLYLPCGLFAASLDADNDEGEGAYYLWDRESVREVLSESSYEIFAEVTGLNDPPNLGNRWHLQRLDAPRDLEAYESARQSLLKERDKRTRPRRDDKALTSWNAIWITGLVAAAEAFSDLEALKQGQKTWDNLLNRVITDNELKACFARDVAYNDGLLDDYATVLWAGLALAGFDVPSSHWTTLITLADRLLDDFSHPRGGFFLTASTDNLFYRPRLFNDDTMPSGNGLAARALIRLGNLLGETRYINAATETLKAAWPYLKNQPEVHTTLLGALEDVLSPRPSLVLRSTHKIPQPLFDAIADLRDQAWIYCISGNNNCLPKQLSIYTVPENTEYIAYVCNDRQCSPPLTEPGEIKTAVQQFDRLNQRKYGVAIKR